MLRTVLRTLSPAGARARLSILIFHRVLPAVDPLFPNEVDVRRFDAICGWLAAWFNVLPLDEAVRRLRSQSLPERALAITFDDGYADNYALALPILLRHRLPATFFIACGYLDGGCMWNDVVINAIRRTQQSPLPLDQLPYTQLSMTSVTDDAKRRTAIDAVIRSAMYLPQRRRSEVANGLAQLAGVAPPNDLMMTSSQVAELHRRGMQIGAHTVSHPILAGLDRASAHAEIAGSKRFLEDLLGERVGLFAYPKGRPTDDYTAATVGIVREVGFDAAVSTAWGCAQATTDLLQLPRFTPWDRSRPRFAARLAGNLWSSWRSEPLVVPSAVESSDAFGFH